MDSEDSGPPEDISHTCFWEELKIGRAEPISSAEELGLEKWSANE